MYVRIRLSAYLLNIGFSVTSELLLSIFYDTAMIEERANLPIISLQPAVVGAAKKTSHVVSQATRNLINIISRRDDSENEDAGIDRLEI